MTNLQVRKIKQLMLKRKTVFFYYNLCLCRTLRECLEANVREMFEILKPIDRNISLSEIPAIPLDVDIIENYPDYYDVDEHYEEKMEYVNLYFVLYEFTQISCSFIKQQKTLLKLLQKLQKL